MKKSLLFCLWVAALWMFPPSARAQTGITSSTTSVSQTLQATDYNMQTGVGTLVTPAAHTLSIRSSSNWALSVRTLTPTFSFTGVGSNPYKPAGDLAVRVSGAGSWIPLSTNSQTVKAGGAQSIGQPPAEVSVDYRFSSSLKNDAPGSYSITVIWTITQP